MGLMLSPNLIRTRYSIPDMIAAGIIKQNPETDNPPETDKLRGAPVMVSLIIQYSVATSESRS